MSKYGKKEDFFCQSAGNKREYLLVELPALIKDYFAHEASEKGICLREEVLIRLGESLKYDYEQSMLFVQKECDEVSNMLDWDELIFNDELAVNEKNLRPRR